MRLLQGFEAWRIAENLLSVLAVPLTEVTGLGSMEGRCFVIDVHGTVGTRFGDSVVHFGERDENRLLDGVDIIGCGIGMRDQVVKRGTERVECFG